MDIAKYRTLFLEEATEHLAEIGQALLDAREGSPRRRGDRSRVPDDALDEGNGRVARLRRREHARASPGRSPRRLAPGGRDRRSAGRRGPVSRSREPRAHGRGRARDRRTAAARSGCSSTSSRRRRPQKKRSACRSRNSGGRAGRSRHRRTREQDRAAPTALGARPERNARPLPQLRRRSDPHHQPAPHRGRDQRHRHRTRASPAASTRWIASSAS